MKEPVNKRTEHLALARHLRHYLRGEKVRILRGKLADKIMTIHQSANDWVILSELPRNRSVMSKRNVEPENGFTDAEITQARRVAEKMKGSLE